MNSGIRECFAHLDFSLLPHSKSSWTQDAATAWRTCVEDTMHRDRNVLIINPASLFAAVGAVGQPESSKGLIMEGWLNTREPTVSSKFTQRVVVVTDVADERYCCTLPRSRDRIGNQDPPLQTHALQGANHCGGCRQRGACLCERERWVGGSRT